MQARLLVCIHNTICVAEVTLVLIGGITTDWKTNIRHIVYIALEHLENKKPKVPAYLATTFPLISESENLDGFDNMVGSDIENLYTESQSALAICVS